jgi:hypothetical protein
MIFATKTFFFQLHTNKFQQVQVQNNIAIENNHVSWLLTIATLVTFNIYHYSEGLFSIVTH